MATQEAMVSHDCAHHAIESGAGVPVATVGRPLASALASGPLAQLIFGPESYQRLLQHLHRNHAGGKLLSELKVFKLNGRVLSGLCPFARLSIKNSSTEEASMLRVCVQSATHLSAPGRFTAMTILRMSERGVRS